MQYNHAVSAAASFNTEREHIRAKDVSAIRRALLAQILSLSDADLLANIDVFDTSEEQLVSTEDHFKQNEINDQGLLDIGAAHNKYTNHGCCLPTLDLNPLPKSKVLFLAFVSKVVYVDGMYGQHLRHIHEDSVEFGLNWVSDHFPDELEECKELLEAIRYFSYFRFDTEPPN